MDQAIVPTPFRGLGILLIDKDAQSLLSMASILQEQSYKVTTVETESKALSILNDGTQKFDLVMADVNMAEKNCLKFMESLQLIWDLPIILMATTAKREMVKEAMSKGACFFFRKPISEKQLKNVWQHVYRARRNRTTGAKNVNKEEQEHDSRGYKDEEVDSIPKIFCKNDEHDTYNDYAGQKDRIKNEETHLDEIKNDGISKYGSDRFVGTESDEPEGSQRRRIGVDLCREVNVELSGSEQTSSGDSRAITGDEWERKDENKHHSNLKKKSRLCWNLELQHKFREAINILGEEARPKSVLELMNVPNLTQRQVASHLQKYRVRALRREHWGATPSPIRNRISISRGRSESIQKPEKTSQLQFPEGLATYNSHLRVHPEKFNPLSVSHPRVKVENDAANFGTLDQQSKYGESSITLPQKYQLYHHSKKYGMNKHWNTTTRAPDYGGILEPSSQGLRPYQTRSKLDGQAAFNRLVHSNFINHDATQDVSGREFHKVNWRKEDDNLSLDVIIQREKGKEKQHLDFKQHTEYLRNAFAKIPFPMYSGHDHESIASPSELQKHLDLTPDPDVYYTCQNPNQFHMLCTELLHQTDIRKVLSPFDDSSNPNKLTTELSDVKHELPGLASPSYSRDQRQNLPKPDNLTKFSKRAQ